MEVVVVPFHGQGHINTMVQFAKRLSSKGIRLTIATTTTATSQLSPTLSSFPHSISFSPIFDDSTLSDLHLHFKERMLRFQSAAAPNLTRLLLTLKDRSPHSTCFLVYHSSLPWALQLARQLNIMAAPFFSISTSSLVCYYRLYLETQGMCLDSEAPSVLPPPDLLCAHHSHARSDRGLHPMILWLLQHFYGPHLDAHFFIINSFDMLEDEVVKWMGKIIEVKTVGPTLPSMYLDKRIEHDVGYGFNQCKPIDEECMTWLNSKPTSSVVYISFGSVMCPTVEQMVEILEAFKLNSTSFLWVIRETEQTKLPTNFVAEMSETSMVVPWCPQLDVLAHDAVGYFMSHCGWNSIIEALSLGVPVLALPQALDQFVGAHFVDRVWGVGISPLADEKGLVAREEIRRCLGEITSGPRAQKIKENVAIWKGMAKEAVDTGGTSDRNINDIIDLIASS